MAGTRGDTDTQGVTWYWALGRGPRVPPRGRVGDTDGTPVPSRSPPCHTWGPLCHLGSHPCGMWGPPVPSGFCPAAIWGPPVPHRSHFCRTQGPNPLPHLCPRVPPEPCPRATPRSPVPYGVPLCHPGSRPIPRVPYPLPMSHQCPPVPLGFRSRAPWGPLCHRGPVTVTCGVPLCHLGSPCATGVLSCPMPRFPCDTRVPPQCHQGPPGATTALSPHHARG